MNNLIKLFYVITSILLCSCNKDVLYSPDKKKKLYISFQSGFSEPTLRVYCTNSSKDYSEFYFSNIGVLEVNWNTDPIQIRSNYIKYYGNKDCLYFTNNYEKDTVGWMLYDMVLLSNGYFFDN